MWKIDRQKTIVKGTEERSVRIRIAKGVWDSASERSRQTALRVLGGSSIEFGSLGAIEKPLQFNVTQHRWILNTGEGHLFETSTYDRVDTVEIDFTYQR
jgi:hypothetical protein